MVVTIDDSWLEQVTKHLGFPNVDNLHLDDDQVKNFCVFEALWKYFNKFPLLVRDQVALDQTVVLDWPDLSAEGKEVFGVKYVSAVDKFGQSSSSSFWDIVRFRSLYGQTRNYSGSGYYRTPYNFNGLRQSFWARRQALDTYTNEGTFKYFVNYDEKKLELHGSIAAKAMVVWAVRSCNFNDVKDTQKFRVVELAASVLLENLGKLSGIAEDSALDVAINADELKKDAEDLRNRVMDAWKNHPDIVLLRSS